jgi:hypothetical protein
VTSVKFLIRCECSDLNVCYDLPQFLNSYLRSYPDGSLSNVQILLQILRIALLFSDARTDREHVQHTDGYQHKQKKIERTDHEQKIQRTETISKKMGRRCHSKCR